MKNGGIKYLSYARADRLTRDKRRLNIRSAGLYNCDCMEAMREYPDKYFDLAIVDPPYGSGGGRMEKENAIRGVV